MAAMTRFEMYAGDARRLRILVAGADGLPADLVGFTARWVLMDTSGQAVLTLVSGQGAQVSDDGEVTVDLVGTATKDLKSKYFSHYLELFSASGQKFTVLYGQATIFPALP